MTLARRHHTNTIVLGAGELYFSELAADGALLGERYLGDSVGATLISQGEVVAVQGGDGSERVLGHANRSRRHQMRFVLHDMALENIALALVGAKVARASDLITPAIAATAAAAPQSAARITPNAVVLSPAAPVPLWAPLVRFTHGVRSQYDTWDQVLLYYDNNYGLGVGAGTWGFRYDSPPAPYGVVSTTSATNPRD